MISKEFKKNNKNRLALQGIGITDGEICETFKLPTDLINNPKINDVMINKMKQLNFQEALLEMSVPEAKKVASTRAAQTKNDVQRLFKLNGIKHKIKLEPLDTSILKTKDNTDAFGNLVNLRTA